MKKYYYIQSENKIESFIIQCSSKMSDGRTCYLGNSYSTGEEVCLYPDFIEYTEHKPKHKIVPAYEVKQPAGLTSNKYIWGGEIRDKRTHSMCARPYFHR